MTTAREQPPATQQREPDRAGVGPRELVILLSAVMALMAVGLDVILPGFPDIREAFDLGEASPKTGQLITFYFFGLAFAQLLWGPMADRFGRKPILYAGIGIYVAGAAMSALAPSFELLLAGRVIWGMGAAGARVVAVAIIRDRFVGEQMARTMSQIMAVFVLVPVVAPSIGVLILAVASWPTVFWFCAVWAVAIGVWSLRLAETLDPAHVRSVKPGQIVGSYRDVLREPLTMGYTVASMFLQVVFTLYIATVELIIGEIYGRGDQFPIIFGIVAASFGVAALVNSRLVGRYGIESMIRGALAAAIAGGAGLVALSATAQGVPSFYLFIFILALTLSQFMLMMPNLNSAAMTPVGHIAGAASALTSAFRIGVGSAIAALLTRFVVESVTPLAVTILVSCLATAAVLVATHFAAARSSTRQA